MTTPTLTDTCHRGHTTLYFEKSGQRRCRECQRENDLLSRRRRIERNGGDFRVPVPELVVSRLAYIINDDAERFLTLAEKAQLDPESLRGIGRRVARNMPSKKLDRLVCALGLVGFVDVLTGKEMVP